MSQTRPSYLQLRDSPHVLVEQYAAKGDGITDDSAAFKSALVAGKGRIELTAGKTYLVKIKASGDAAGGGDATAYVGSNVFSIKGNGASIVGHTAAATNYGIEYGYMEGFISLNQFDFVNISDLSVTGTYFNGFAAANNPATVTDTMIGPFSVIAGRYLNNVNITNVAASQVPQLIYITDSINGSIKNSAITYCENAVTLASCKDFYLEKCLISGCPYSSAGQRGVDVGSSVYNSGGRDDLNLQVVRE